MPEGSLFIVATPIGNLQDMTPRAISVLQDVDLILAEDTRNSLRLLQAFAINTPMKACHEHNEKAGIEHWLERIRNGEQIALISDAGTPLVSDPGYLLVSAAQQAGLRVVPIPGACSIIAALSACGLPSDRFIFEGFLSSKRGARQKKLQSLKDEPRTLIFLEAPHRILDCVSDLQTIFGTTRRAAVARELTKTYETIHIDSLQSLSDWLAADENQQRGEIVLVVEGADEAADQTDVEPVLKVLLGYLPLSQAVAATCSITGAKRNPVYKLAMELEAGDPDD